MARGPCGEPLKADFPASTTARRIRGWTVQTSSGPCRRRTKYPALSPSRRWRKEEKPADHLQEAAASGGQCSQKGAGRANDGPGALAPASFRAQDEPFKESVFPPVVLCAVMYKISYCADQGLGLPVYTEKWQSRDVVGVCISHEPISECSCCFWILFSDCSEFRRFEIMGWIISATWNHYRGVSSEEFTILDSSYSF